MATGVVIRLQSLPLTAGTIDIRRFFSGLSVPDGGVHIIGGEDGTAFILFTTDEDARQAMMRDGQMLFTEKIKLRLSSHTEMRKLIEDSQRRYEELRGLRPPEPPITNLSSRSTATGRVQPTSPKPGSQEFAETNDLFVELKNLPYTIGEEDIVYFFAPLPLSAIRIMRDDKGRVTGSGFAKFKCAEDRMEGLKRDRNTIGPRYIRVFPTTERMWLLTGSQPCDTFRPNQDATRKRPPGGTPTNDGTPKRSRALSPLRYDNCVELRGLPHTANYKTILDFFHHFQIAEEGVFVELDGKMCKGHAYVEFMTEHDYKAALLRDGEIIEGKQFRVISISRQAMMEQIKLFKKYIKVKRDEEIRREYEERQQNELKLMEEERKRKHEEEMARKRLKKQREMEEWLSRQHAKEEEERKRLELEKRILAQEKTREQEKVRKERQLASERQKMAAAAKLDKEKQQIKQSQANKDQSMPMDLEDEDNQSPKIVTASQYSSSQEHNSFMNQGITSTASSTMERFTPISTGSSGSPMVQQQYMSTPPIRMQPFAPRFSPTGPRDHVLPPPPHFSGLRQGPPLRPMGLTPPPALPPPPSPMMLGVNPPPPLPTLPPPPIAPFENGHGQNNNANGPPPPTSAQSDATNPNNTSDFSTYVRVANSPWNVDDEQVKSFFMGLQIAPNGIKFVNSKYGKRSGHIFVKFTTLEDANKAAFLDKTKFGYREVLVQKTNYHQMEEIVKKCSFDPIESILGVTPNIPFKPPVENISVDRAFEQKIIRDQLTCVRLSNVPENVIVDDIVHIMRGISIVPGGIQILRDNIGKCVGEIFIELVTPQDCARASSFHSHKMLNGREIKIIPVSLNDMKQDLNLHFERLRPDAMRSSPRGFDGARPPFPGPDFSRNPPPLPNSPFPEIRPRMDRPPLDMHDDMRLRMPMDLRNSPPMQGDMMRDRPPAFHDRMPRDFPRFPEPGMPRPPMPDDRMFPRGPPGPWDGPMRHPMHPGPGFPFDNRGAPIRHPQPVPIRMGNLSFNVKPDEILDFFNRYNPIPPSVEFFHHKDGKLTGNGVVYVPGIEAAEAAIKDLNGKELLRRKIKLQIG